MRYYFLLIKRFFSMKAYNKKDLFWLFFFSAVSTLSSLSVPYAGSLVVDAATEGDFTLASIYCGVFLLTGTIYALLNHLDYYYYAKNSTYIHDDLQRKILNKVVTLDPDYMKTIPKAEIINTGFEDVTMCQRIPDYLFDFVAAMVSIVADAAILVFVDPLIGAITLALTTISMFTFVYHMRRRDYYYTIRRGHQDEISGLYSQIIDGHKEVHSFNLAEDLRGILEKEKKSWRKIYRKQRIHNDLGESMTPLILGLGRIIAYLITATLILNGEYGVATLVLVIGYFENMIERYEEASDIILALSKSTVAINRVYRLLNYQPRRKQKFGADSTDDIKGEIAFKNVSFTYDRKPQMKNVSFRIAPHSLTGIVGKSGSGKSTIFRLLLRLYKPTKGAIAIDGKNISDYTKEVYASNVAIVNQKPFVFDMTIRQNLSLVDPDPEHQVEACKTAGIHDAILRLEKGYDTPLVGDAANLSGGQKQLLALARTLLSRSEILLFDEVTSALDADTTKQIVDVLQKLKKDHTVLVITHKPEIMRKMDDIIVIDQGRMVGRGTPKNLLHNKYYKLLQK